VLDEGTGGTEAVTSTVVVGSIWRKKAINPDTGKEMFDPYKNAKVVGVIDYEDERHIIYQRFTGLEPGPLSIAEIKKFRANYFSPSEVPPE
jgi:hypothetical protein